MENLEFKARVEQLKRSAQGRWTEILRTLGVDATIVNKRNQPCPACGGTDRFQYTDKFGHGDYICRGCGHGDGFKLLMHCKGWEFGTASKHVEEILRCGELPPLAKPNAPSSERMKKLARRMWEEAKPVTVGDEVDRYLRNRGLRMTQYPRTIRFHPALGYFEKDESGKSKKVRDYPGMLALIQGADGQAVTLHRTYLQEGKKALVRDAKKVLSAGINGAAVRLFEATDELAITEGIETALAVHAATGKPVWAAVSAGNLEKLWIPESVRRVCVYADNDADSEYDGQSAAFALARRLKKEERKTGTRRVEVFIPKAVGNDWADVWLSRLAHDKQVA